MNYWMEEFIRENEREMQREFKNLNIPVVIKSVCKHCGKPKEEHTKASGMCKDRFAFFEQTVL